MRTATWLRWLLIGAIIFSVFPLTALAQTTQPAATPEAQLAQALDLPLDRLQLLTASHVTLLNGRTLLQVRALDTGTGRIVGATFEGDQLVDEQQARAEAGAWWRDQHGAQTPQLLRALQDLPPAARLDVAIWLRADIQPLERLPNVPLNTARPNPIGAAALKAPRTRSGVPDNTVILAQVEAFKDRNTAALAAQVAPVQARFAAVLLQRGLKAEYASDTVPSVVVRQIDRVQLAELARLPEVDAIYAVPDQAGPSLSIARYTQNGAALDDAGYIGQEVKVSVTEGERAYGSNPYLQWSSYFSPTKPAAGHPTGVGGIIKSTAPGFQGLARGVELVNANGSYSGAEWNIMSAAMDWGSITATVLNNSWYWDSPNNPYFWEADRHQDYFVRNAYDFVAVAAGNFGNGCSSNFTSYVVSPAKGYNVMSVGNYEDANTLTWADDTMDVCSSFGNPDADAPGGFTHDKPEVAAVGASISSTVMSAITSTAIGNIGSGTSYASPMVAALAADIIQADPNLADEPERIKAIIMATALHNVEGNTRLSDKDGAGGIDLTAALTTVERGHHDNRLISSATTFPITLTQYAYKGERVRFVIDWLSNPTAAYTSDPLPVDLNLTALRASGAVITSSASTTNNFEIVEFVAPATETYQFRIERFGAYTGNSTWLAAAWWVGEYRIAPDTGYSDPAAPPIGTQLAIHPTDWSPVNYWRVLGIRPVESDHDLYLYDQAQFTDPALRFDLNAAYGAGDTVDFIAVDGNHWPTGKAEHYLVYNYIGTGGYRVNWSNQGQLLAQPGRYGPFAMTSSEVVKIFDVWFKARQGLQIVLQPTGSNLADLGMQLFRSDGATAATWTKARGQSVAAIDQSPAPDAVERLSYKTDAVAADYLGLVVYSKTNAGAQFYLLVLETGMYLPVTLRQ